MKNHRSNLILASLISAAALALVACSPSGGSGADGSAAVMRAFPASADVAMYFDQEAFSESKFSEAVQKMQEDSPANEQAEEFSKMFTEATGLEDDDITDFALAVSGLENVQTNPSALKISGGIFATKPVTADQVVAAAKLIADQSGESLELTVTPGDGADFIAFPSDPNAPEIHAAVVTGDSSTIVFFGDLDSVNAALARQTGSVPAGLSEASAGLVPRQQGWISIILPESFRAQLAGMTAQMEQMMPGLSKANSLSSIGVGMKSADSLDIAVGLNLGSTEDAAAVEAILNNQLISFAKMMLSSATSEPLPLLNSLSATHSGDRAALSMVLTLKDMEILQDQLMGMLPTPGGMGVTPAVR